jgi:hypothetical protein
LIPAAVSCFDKKIPPRQQVLAGFFFGGHG